MNTFSHIPVLLKEAVEYLEVKSGKKYIDATLGGAGHTSEILRLGGVVLGLDQDQDALEFVKEKQKENIKKEKLVVSNGNFKDLQKIAFEYGFEKVDGILFDLGVSSYQLDSSGRGFSIKKDEKLDMRMDKNRKINAFEVVNYYPYERLVEIFYKYGEEHNAKGIAQAVVDIRKKKEIETTKELASIIERVGHKNENIHPATRVFQAIRIEVNGELEALKEGLVQGLELLEENGRLVVISFHSLEDRIVKQTFAQFERKNMGKLIVKKPITASFSEFSKNRRSRSAKLRVFAKN